uniref:Major facilitator superfamily (MFS) profile domain-containing protein n=1 Tax=Glossina palpalis gambiensis TaxID=67801 RepID=A0A1B0B9K7_9MUSC
MNESPKMQSLNRDEISEARYSLNSNSRTSNNRQMIATVIYLTLLLDNVLLTVIVPILPHYLASMNRMNTSQNYTSLIRVVAENVNKPNSVFTVQYPTYYHREDTNATLLPIMTKHPILGKSINTKFSPLRSENHNEMFKSFHMNAHNRDNRFNGPENNKSTKGALTSYNTSIDEMRRGDNEANKLIGENSSIGILLAMKALLQLIFNPIVGSVSCKFGYHLPIIAGTICLLISSLAFAVGVTYADLLIARAIQGIGSACINICGMSLIAQNYPEEDRRSKIMGIVLGSIALGVLMGYPFGGILYDLYGKTTPLIILATVIFICLVPILPHYLASMNRMNTSQNYTSLIRVVAENVNKPNSVFTVQYPTYYHREDTNATLLPIMTKHPILGKSINTKFSPLRSENHNEMFKSFHMNAHNRDNRFNGPENNKSTKGALTSYNTSIDEMRRGDNEANKLIGENSSIGILLAMKALLQLIFNPIVGSVSCKFGYHLPIIAGTICLLISSLAFAVGVTYADLLIARAIQGIGSACINICGMSLIAQNYPEEDRRSKIMGIVLGSIALGVLMGYPFGGILYDLYGKTTPLIILATVIFICLALILAIWFSTSVMAVLEPCLPIWLMQHLKPTRWQLGTVFIPDSVGYFVGTNFFGSIAYKYGQVKIACVSMMLIGISAMLIPRASSVAHLLVPHFGLGLGIGIVDAALVPLLAKFMDDILFHEEPTSLNQVNPILRYGNVYAIQQTSVSLAYFLAPLIGGELAQAIGFDYLMRTIGAFNILYGSALLYSYQLFDPKLLREKQNEMLLNDSGYGTKYRQLYDTLELK